MEGQTVKKQEIETSSNILTKYENLIRITDIDTKKTATVSVVVKNFPDKYDTQDMLTVFLTILTEALLISQRNNIQVYDVLVDCQGTTAKNISYKFGKQLIAVLKTTFNNTMGRCVIFNTNILFKTVYKVLSPLIDKPTKEKIKIF